MEQVQQTVNTTTTTTTMGPATTTQQQQEPFHSGFIYIYIGDWVKSSKIHATNSFKGSNTTKTLLITPKNKDT